MEKWLNFTLFSFKKLLRAILIHNFYSRPPPFVESSLEDLTYVMADHCFILHKKKVQNSDCPVRLKIHLIGVIHLRKGGNPQVTQSWSAFLLLSHQRVNSNVERHTHSQIFSKESKILQSINKLALTQNCAIRDPCT